MNTSSPSVLTVTLNPAIDQTVTIPGFAVGAVNRVEHSRIAPGGKGVNSATNLAEYGFSVAATGFLGVENSAVFEEHFVRREITNQFVLIAGQTRVGIKITDPTTHQTTDINFAGQEPTPEEVYTLRQKLDALCAWPYAWVILGGSVPPGIEADIYSELTSLLRSHGKKVVLDTSGEPLRQGLQSRPHVIKPNIHELEELLDTKLTTREQIIEAARTLSGRGIELVVVSMGAEGALFIKEAETVLAIPPKVDVGSTVGAGDAMVAGTVAGHLGNLSLPECARLATAFSIAVLTRGESPHSFGNAVDSALPQVEIQLL